MSPPGSWPPPPVLECRTLVLEPLRVEHAEEMALLLDDVALHTFIGGQPATLHQLRQIYTLQAGGRSPDGTERWFTWILRRRDSREAAGYVQATLTEQDAVTVAEVAWVVAVPHQRQGFAREAASAVVGWLWSVGTGRVIAHIHPGHVASEAIAAAVALHPTGTVVDGEVRWESVVTLPPSDGTV